MTINSTGQTAINYAVLIAHYRALPYNRIDVKSGLNPTS